MDQFRKVDDLSVEDLRDEVWLWRTDAAARLASLKVDLEILRPRSASGKEARREHDNLAETLREAMTGRYHATCFVCGFSIRPGDAVISDVNEGEMHADCPEVEGGAQALKPGDKVYMDPESIVIDEGHPEGGEAKDKPDHLVAHEATRLYTHEQIVQKAAASRAQG